MRTPGNRVSDDAGRLESAVGALPLFAYDPITRGQQPYT